MTNVVETVDVAVDVATAYNQWTQFESFPQFMEGVEQSGFTEAVADKTGLIKRRVKGYLDRFKQFIEYRGQETGAWRGYVPRTGG